MSLRTVLGWVAVIVVVIAWVTDPAGFGHLISSAIGALKDAGHALGTTVRTAQK